MSGSIRLVGGSVLTEQGWVDTDLTIVDGVIADAAGDPGPTELDCSGLLVAPGLVDVQCNGAASVDLRSSPERIWEVSAALPRWGVTAWLPTIVTSTPDVIAEAQATIAAGPPPGWSGATPLGLHLEGPFLSPAAAGAHPPDLLRAPDADEASGWSPEAGILLVTLAPELDGALDVVETLRSNGVVVSIGHSQATAAQVDAAIAAGATSVTHLFNAMSPLHHREPGVAGTALHDARLSVGLIADGVHVDPRVVRIAERALGDRLLLVSDAVALLGVDGHDHATGVRLADGTLAGSVLPLVQAVTNLVAWTDSPPERALRAASSRPAGLLGDTGRGRLAPGCRGDAVVLTEELDLVATVVAGELLHHRP